MTKPQPSQDDSDDYFAGCPKCNKTSLILNAGRDHYGLCHDHETAWWIGSNLFSSWRDETKEEQHGAWEKFEHYDIERPEFDSTRPKDARFEAQQEAANEVLALVYEAALAEGIADDKALRIAGRAALASLPGRDPNEPQPSDPDMDNPFSKLSDGRPF